MSLVSSHIKGHTTQIYVKPNCKPWCRVWCLQAALSRGPALPAPCWDCCVKPARRTSVRMMPAALVSSSAARATVSGSVSSLWVSGCQGAVMGHLKQ